MFKESNEDHCFAHYSNVLQIDIMLLIITTIKPGNN